jgi:hypothetical protein
MITKEKMIILIGFCFFAVGFGTYVIVNVVQAIKFMRHDPASTTLHKVDTIPSEDSSLFSPASLAHLKLQFGWQNKYRQVSYILWNRQYELEITQYDLAKNSPLPTLFHLTKKWSGPTVMETYTPVRLYDGGRFSFRLAPIQPLKDIFLTYYGEKMNTIISTDSLLEYRLLGKDLCIRNAVDSPADLVLSNDKDEFGPSLHIDLIVCKRQGKVYFMFFTPIDENRHVDPIVAGELLRQ